MAKLENVQPRSDPQASEQRFVDRYDLHELLGRGGMATVYRATDLSSGRSLALKQMTLPEQAERRAPLVALFEREFHTLSELRHPNVIAAYDYGVAPDGCPYYTMELLDGGDLRELAPLPWRAACGLLFDVCSSLALLHSRRLLHRDITPRNIRCTRDGTAKLIDFGALAPMTVGGGTIVGTPGFTAPETVHRSALDARTDLYALGASLYFALTGRVPYPARTFAELFSVWSSQPAAPSTYVPAIPRALDDLVLSLLSVEPALRPPSAFEVMQRLAAIAELQGRESSGVSRAYLATPALIGRSELLVHVREVLRRAPSADSGGLLLRAAGGLGRSRMLDAFALEAKTFGARVLRAAASGQPRDFEVALALTQHLVEALPSDALADKFPQLFQRVEIASQAEVANDVSPPEPVRSSSRLRPADELRADRDQLHRSLVRLMRAVCNRQSLVLAVDDVHCIDEPSAAVLAELIDARPRAHVFVALTAEVGAESSLAQEALARRCEQLSLEALSQEQTQALFGSVFGDVPNLGRLAQEIFKLARGNPRQSMDIAQHLVDHGTIVYAAGIWTLPASFSAGDLPKSADDAIRARIAKLTPLARSLAEAHALAFYEVFEHAHYHALAAGEDSRAIDEAVDLLVSQQALLGDGRSYVIANRVWAAALDAGLTDAARQERHRTLAELYRTRSALALIHHLLAGGRDSEGVDLLIARHRGSQSDVEHNLALEQNVGKLCASYTRAIESAIQLGRSPREVNDLRRWCVAISVASEARHYWAAAPAWLEQLLHDSGLLLYWQDSTNSDPGARLTAALTGAQASHQGTPEAERVYRVDEAIPLLAEYVAYSIAIGVRCVDSSLLLSLPRLLEPFAPLSPVLDALWQNVLGCIEANLRCHYRRAHARWIETHTKLRAATAADVQHVEAIRNAVAFAIGMVEAVFGLASAARWADQLDGDPYQRVSALYLRKIVRLEQGDWPGAEKLQRQAEVLALRAHVPAMFSNTLTVEISAHARARDLAGMKDVIERERVLASRHPGWIPFLLEAEARFELVRGDFATAKTRFEHCIELCAIDSQRGSSCLPVWVTAQSGRCEAMLALGHAVEARSAAKAALAICDELEIDALGADLQRTLALSEAKLGDFPAAVAGLEALIDEQTRFGVTGLRLGLTYEARAEVALWAEDPSGFDEYARLTAREYRHGADCPLGARYERLVQEARRRGFQSRTVLSDFELTTIADPTAISLPELQSMVGQALSGLSRAPERWLRALQLVCETRAARVGHAYAHDHAGPRLLASLGAPEPPASLRAHVLACIEQTDEQFETRTLAADQLPPSASTGQAVIVHADGVEYELSLLTRIVDHELEVVGVLAIARDEKTLVAPGSGYLLEVLAALLVPGHDASPA